MKNKPTAKQVAWVFRKICDHISSPGSFRKLIYDRMGFKEKDYVELMSAGGMLISNLIFDYKELIDIICELCDEELYKKIKKERTSYISGKEFPCDLKKFRKRKKKRGGANARLS